MNRRVVITGMGAVTPVGIGVETFWKNLLAGKCGIGPITRFDPTNSRSSLAGEVSDFDPLQYQDFKTASNQTGSLFVYYLLTRWNELGKLTGKEFIVKTIVTTELIFEMAKKYNVDRYDVRRRPPGPCPSGRDL